MSSGIVIGGLRVKPVLDINECLRDSPKFRSALDEQLHTIDSLDGKLEKLLKSSHNMIESGKAYIDSQHSFCTSLTELSVYFRQDKFVYNGFGKCTAGLMELAKFHSTLLDQVNRAICRNIGDFLKTEVRAMKEVRSSHEKATSEYDSALNRNSAIPKGKGVEAEEALHCLNTARTNFRYSALKILFSISVLQQRKRFDILDNLLSVMNGHRTFFHQGSDYYKDSEPSLKAISVHLNEMRGSTLRDADLTAFLGNSTQLVLTTPDYMSGALVPPDCLMQGYLFRRSSAKTFKTWKRRWFELLDRGQLVYRKRADDAPTFMEEDLRICLVRPMADTDRRFCFELISPNKTHILQADGEEVFQAWVSALQLAIQSAIHNSTSTRTSDPSSPPQQQTASQLLQLTAEKAKVIKSILNVEGNNECCDCGASDPEWASANLGITLCIECSGIHRSLGVHYSKVKSLKLDSWEPGLLKVMGELGNNLVNRIYMAKADVVDTLGITRASPHCSREVRETWIRVKYVDRAFVAAPKLNGDSGRPGKLIRKWSVRKPFRRQRNRSGGSSGKASRESSLQVTPGPSGGTGTGGLEESSESESFKSFQSKGTGSSGSEAEGGVLVFGADLPPTQTQVVGHLADAEGEESAEEDPDARDIGTEESVETLDANTLLYKASRVANLGVMSEAIALGADKNWANPKEDASTPLHQAIYGGSVTACEYLILNGARINATDGKLRTPLLIATELGHTGQICLFLRNRADHHLKDVEGRTALDVAITSEHADIVTLLRLAQMDEEMRVGETSQTDDSFQEIVRDIAQRAQDEQGIPSTTKLLPNPLP